MSLLSILSIYVRDLLKTDPYLNRMLEPHRSTDMFQGVWLRHLSTNAPLLRSCILLPTLNARAQDSKCSSNDPVYGLGCRSDGGKDKVVLHSAFELGLGVEMTLTQLNNPLLN